MDNGTINATAAAARRAPDVRAAAAAVVWAHQRRHVTEQRCCCSWRPAAAGESWRRHVVDELAVAGLLAGPRPTAPAAVVDEPGDTWDDDVVALAAALGLDPHRVRTMLEEARTSMSDPDRRVATAVQPPATAPQPGRRAPVVGGVSAALAVLGVLAIGAALLPPGAAAPSSTPPAASTATAPAPDRRALA